MIQAGATMVVTQVLALRSRSNTMITVNISTGFPFLFMLSVGHPIFCDTKNVPFKWRGGVFAQESFESLIK
jgi:hypothetical protein